VRYSAAGGDVPALPAFPEERAAFGRPPIPAATEQESGMNDDRVKGSADQMKGGVKETVGNLTGDAKLQAEGKGDKAKGKLENAVGGVKDAVKDAVDR
jgi:uncharacterized protein YjbJ (UPF0337 family)